MAKLIRLRASYDRKTWRTIDIPSTASLERLAGAIIDAYGFMLDHAFGFYNNIKEHYNSTEVYTLFADMKDGPGHDPRDGQSVRNTKIGDVFATGKEMLFLFDYGDDWFFHLQCLDDDAPREKGKRYPKVIDSKGEAPEQYPSDEDDDYDDEDEDEDEDEDKD
jgi:hypothetical protein